MARSLGSLTLDLVARIGGFQQSMNQASRITQQTASNINRSFQNASSPFTQINAAADGLVSRLPRLAGALGVAFSTRQLYEYANTFTNLQNRLRLVTTGTEQLGDATESVFRIALQTSQGVNGVAEVFQRFANNAGALGINLKDVGDLTNTVSKAVAISGSTAESAQAGLVQFGQALASGTLRGEELNSVLEQLPGLAQAIAGGLGVSVGQLRAMGAEGEITSAKLITALRAASKQVDALFATRQITVPQALENLNTALTRFVGNADTALGVTSSIADALDGLAQAIGRVNVDTIVEPISTLNVVLRAVGDGIDYVLTVIGNIIDSLPGVREAFSSAFQPGAFTEFVNSTAREFDKLVEGITGGFGGISRVVDAVRDNIANSFQNAFNTVTNATNGFVNGMIERLNKVTGFIQFNPIGADNKPTNLPTYNLQDSFNAGFQSTVQNLGALNRVQRETNQNWFLQMSRGLQTTDDAVRTSAAVSEKATKSKVTDGQRLIKSLQEQVNAFGEYQTEVGKLQANLDAGLIKFDNPVQQNEAFGLAATKDFLKENQEAWEDQQKAAKDAAKVVQGSTDDMTQFAVQAARNIEDALGDGLYDVVTGKFDDIGSNFLQLLTKMATQAAAAKIGEQLFGNFGNSGNFGGLFGGILSSLLGTQGINSVASGVRLGGNGAALNGLQGLAYAFSTGGYTGAGDPSQIAGFVHKGEYVINADATQRLGLDFLQSLNGYARGGLAGAPAGPLAGVGGVGGGVNVNVNVNGNNAIDTSGTTAGYGDLGRMVGELVRTEISNMQVQSLRQGGTLWKAQNGMVGT